MTETDTAAPKAKKAAKSNPRAKTSSAKAHASKAAPQAAKQNPIELASGIIADLARTNFEESVETARAVLKSGDIKAAVELQNELFRTTFKRNLDAAREINELTVSAVREAMGPYAQRFTEAFEKLRAA
jgi:phasin family protein